MAEIKTITTEDLLRHIVRVSHSPGIKHVSHGEEFSKRLLEIKEVLQGRKEQMAKHETDSQISNAMERLEKTLVKADHVLEK